jgi:FHA domain-containing protein/cysteine-rich secretory family protein
MPSPGIRLIASGSTVPREFSARSKEISIGSAAGNDLVIDETTVSRHHAKIVGRRGAYRIIDLESTNGTYVNGERVRGSLTFKAGDELRFGSARYRFNRLLAPAAKKRRSSIPRLRAVLIFAVLFASAFAVTEYQIIWDKIDELVPSRIASFVPAPETPSAALPTRSPFAASATVVASRSTPIAPTPLPSAMMPAPSVASAIVAASPAATSANPYLHRALGADASWLDVLNRYRTIAGLLPVTLDPSLAQGVEAHARYVVANYSEAIKRGSIGGEAHTEDPAKPYYSAAGLAAGSDSVVDARFPPSGTVPAPTEAIDALISIPFHRLLLLNPGLRRAAFGQYCGSGVCVSLPNVVSGADRPPAVSTPLPHPVMFPPAGSIISIGTADGSEWPSPLISCPGYSKPFGLAISLQLGGRLDSRLTNYSITRATDRQRPSLRAVSTQIPMSIPTLTNSSSCARR